MEILLQFLLGSSICFSISGSQKVPLNIPLNPATRMPKNHYNATFINTDGTLKPCTSHADCYNTREPIYWCRLARNQRWTRKGCYCDPVVGACVIERITDLGPRSNIRNYALCIPRECWKCPFF